MRITMESAGDYLKTAREHVSKAMTQAREAGIEAHANGVPETVIAATLGVDRMTVRKWLGKR